MERIWAIHLADVFFYIKLDLFLSYITCKLYNWIFLILIEISLVHIYVPQYKIVGDIIVSEVLKKCSLANMFRVQHIYYF